VKKIIWRILLTLLAFAMIIGVYLLFKPIDIHLKPPTIRIQRSSLSKMLASLKRAEISGHAVLRKRTYSLYVKNQRWRLRLRRETKIEFGMVFSSKVHSPTGKFIELLPHIRTFRMELSSPLQIISPQGLSVELKKLSLQTSTKGRSVLLRVLLRYTISELFQHLFSTGVNRSRVDNVRLWKIFRMMHVDTCKLQFFEHAALAIPPYIAKVKSANLVLAEFSLSSNKDLQGRLRLTTNIEKLRKQGGNWSMRDSNLSVVGTFTKKKDALYISAGIGQKGRNRLQLVYKKRSYRFPLLSFSLEGFLGESVQLRIALQAKHTFEKARVLLAEGLSLELVAQLATTGSQAPFEIKIERFLLRPYATKKNEFSHRTNMMSLQRYRSIRSALQSLKNMPTPTLFVGIHDRHVQEVFVPMLKQKLQEVLHKKRWKGLKRTTLVSFALGAEKQMLLLKLDVNTYVESLQSPVSLYVEGAVSTSYTGKSLQLHPFLSSVRLRINSALRKHLGAVRYLKHRKTLALVNQTASVNDMINTSLREFLRYANQALSKNPVIVPVATRFVKSRKWTELLKPKKGLTFASNKSVKVDMSLHQSAVLVDENGIQILADVRTVPKPPGDKTFVVTLPRELKRKTVEGMYTTLQKEFNAIKRTIFLLSERWGTQIVFTKSFVASMLNASLRRPALVINATEDALKNKKTFDESEDLKIDVKELHCRGLRKPFPSYSCKVHCHLPTCHFPCNLPNCNKACPLPDCGGICGHPDCRAKCKWYKAGCHKRKAKCKWRCGKCKARREARRVVCQGRKRACKLRRATLRLNCQRKVASCKVSREAIRGGCQAREAACKGGREAKRAAHKAKNEARVAKCNAKRVALRALRHMLHLGKIRFRGDVKGKAQIAIHDVGVAGDLGCVTLKSDVGAVIDAKISLSYSPKRLGYLACVVEFKRDFNMRAVLPKQPLSLTSHISFNLQERNLQLRVEPFSVKVGLDDSILRKLGKSFYLKCSLLGAAAQLLKNTPLKKANFVKKLHLHYLWEKHIHVDIPAIDTKIPIEDLSIGLPSRRLRLRPTLDDRSLRFSLIR